VEEFGASGLASRRIVEGIIVEKLWKHLVNAAPFCSARLFFEITRLLRVLL
jgi:hypothetical protein